MTSTVASLQNATRHLDRNIRTIGLRADVKRESDYFLANIRSVSSADEFLKNDRLYRFAMTAFGLQDMIYAKAFMRKVLTEGIDAPESFALQLADNRFRDFAEAFNFKRYAATATAFERAQQGTVDRYLRIQFESEEGTKDEGVRLALYFQRTISSVQSVYGILGDRALYRVVQTALGLPAASSAIDIDRQAAVISERLDLSDLNDPSKLDAFLMRFAAKWQAAKTNTAQLVPPLGIDQTALTRFDSTLLLQLQSFGTGRRG